MKLIMTLMLAALLAPIYTLAVGPPGGGASSIGSSSQGLDDQKQRLRDSHIKQLALGEEAEAMYEVFETLALEVLVADEASLKEVWTSATTTFQLQPNRADDAKDVVDYYVEIFSLSNKVSQQETALDALGQEEKGNTAKNKVIKKQLKSIRKLRKNITKLRGKIKSTIKSVIQYDNNGDQRQHLDNWLAVSTGLLRDIREKKENKKTSKVDQAQ